MAHALSVGDLLPSAARWGGKPVDKWTRQRSEAIRAKSRFTTLRKSGALPEMYDVMLGPRFAELVAVGKLHAYPLLQRARRRSEMPPGASWKLRDRHIAALALVVTGHLSCRTSGLIISHATMAGLLGISPRSAGSTMRDLSSWGLLVTEPWFERAGEPLRQSSWYRVSDFAVRFFDIGPRRGTRSAPTTSSKICQAERSTLRVVPEKERAAVAASLSAAPDASPALDSDAQAPTRAEPSPGGLPEGRASRAPHGPVAVGKQTLGERVAELAQVRIDRELKPVRAMLATIDRERRRLAEREATLDRRQANLPEPAARGDRGAGPVLDLLTDAELAAMRRGKVTRS